MEEQLRLASKFYRCRDAARMLYGKEYIKAITPYQEKIIQAMKEYDLDSEVEAAIRMVNKFIKQDREAPEAMVILAAAVELVEPSQN